MQKTNIVIPFQMAHCPNNEMIFPAIIVHFGFSISLIRFGDQCAVFLCIYLHKWVGFSLIKCQFPYTYLVVYRDFICAWITNTHNHSHWCMWERTSCIHASSCVCFNGHNQMDLNLLLVVVLVKKEFKKLTHGQHRSKRILFMWIFIESSELIASTNMRKFDISFVCNWNIIMSRF